eukprot:364279-Chlamydomonas_euryale.AAC.3
MSSACALAGSRGLALRVRWLACSLEVISCVDSHPPTAHCVSTRTNLHPPCVSIHTHPHPPSTPQGRAAADVLPAPPHHDQAPQRLMEAEVTIDVGSDDDDDGSVGGIGNGGVDGGAETRGSDRRGLWSSGRVSALERNAGTPATDVPCNAGGGWEPGTVRSAMGGALQASGGPSKGEGAGSEERWEASVTGGAAGFPSQQQRQDQQDQMGAGPGRGWHECEGLMEAVRACRSSAELVDMVAARSGGGSGGGSSSGSGSDGGLSAPELVLCCSQLARVADPSGGTRAWTHAQVRVGRGVEVWSGVWA